ncbi:hypothetical protein DESUT3_29650 [Desulfuromonas versatilis]|uniref:CHRD domain-containing protein n=1 Tax=Desulfuromonas versatilis TaxID=2802975 RepID=A0ABM8HVE9_9BACT|nr:CHRD domain-containing protein [Desulfuromonas versatilis]BCR05896.1 hypothetical protein DESUT3_29650 [Desulfuromonas versatilis]
MKFSSRFRETVGLWAIVLLLPGVSMGALDSISGKQAGDPPALTSILPVGVAPDGDPTQVAVSLANGFPLWYQDANGLKLQLCLDSTLEVAPGVVINPCEYEPPAPFAPASFPANFGAEAIYWSAAALGSFSSTGIAVPSSALLVLALEATGANAAALVDGNQAVFSRIRIRVDAPVVGTYRVTHPYGTRDYVVTTPGVRAINQTQDLGIAAAQNFLAAMLDGPLPAAPPAPTPPSLDAGIVNADGLTIGPFLVPAAAHGGVFDPLDPATFTGGPVSLGGATYIGLPFAPPAPAAPTIPVDIFQPAVGSAFIPAGEAAPANFFRIELVADAAGNPPDADGSFGGFFLNADAASQVVQIDDFLLIGKVFEDQPNLAPVAAADVAGTAAGRSVNIDVVANDLDVLGAGNAYGIAPQAIALADAAGPVLNAAGMPQLTANLPTLAGGTVRRITNISTGRTSFLYTPPPAVGGIAFTGEDSFQYVIQDAGGLISTPATVSVTVEELLLARADYRGKTGKWHLSGTSSDATDNLLTFYGGPRARLTPDQQVQVPAVNSEARGQIFLRVTESAIEFALDVAPLPATAVTGIQLHVAAAGAEGPVIFSLYESGVDGPFTGSLAGTLTAFDLQTRAAAGVSSFADAVSAILGGNVYLNVHTGAFPSGEIRGQLQRPVIGTAAVVGGDWEFKGKSTAAPGKIPSVSVESSNKVRVLGVPLRMR